MTFPRSVLACCALLATCRNAAPPPSSPMATGPVSQQIDAILAREEAALIATRRDFHQHPELSGQEARTASIVAGALRRLGLEVRTDVGGHGVVALLRFGRPGPLIAYRADMDAVPTSAPDPVDFRSLAPGVRHICGHDLHTTIGLALATALSHVRDSLAGSVLFVFQPAEERATGARAMLADGVFAGGLPGAIYGLHTSAYETGRLAVTAGPMMAGRDRFEVVLSGAGDLNAAANDVVQRLRALGTIDASQIGVSQPPDFVLMQVSPPTLEGGRARVLGTVTVASAEPRARVRAAVTEGLAATLPSGVTAASTYEARWIAGVTNDSALTASAANAVRAAVGSAALATVTTIPAAFSEDFGSFQERVPGVFFYLGVANATRGWNGLPHNDGYVADERAIVIGARAMAAVLLDRLRGG